MTEYCQHVMQSLIIRHIRMGTLDRQEGLNYYGKAAKVYVNVMAEFTNDGEVTSAKELYLKDGHVYEIQGK